MCCATAGVSALGAKGAAVATRVLLVEDESLIRMILAEALADEGFEVLEAASGDEAAHVAEGAGFDLLLTDIQMPGRLDGVALARHLLQSRPDLPVVYVTGRPESLDRVERRDRAAYVRKPYSPNEVIAVVRGLLGADGA